MEVLSHSDVQYVGESNCPQLSTGTRASTGACDGPNLLQLNFSKRYGADTAAIGVSEQSNFKKKRYPPQMGSDLANRTNHEANLSGKDGKPFQGKDVINKQKQRAVIGEVALDIQYNEGEMVRNISQKPSCDLEEDRIAYAEDDTGMWKEKHFRNNYELSDNHHCRDFDIQEDDKKHLFVDKNQSHVRNGYPMSPCGHPDAGFSDKDETVALWVKWRGKWQAGIRCSRVDWPLSVLNSKPTHGRKKYFVVFFPQSRTHSWADMLLVRSISELPQPLTYGTHHSALESVKDLTLPHRYIMQKLAVAMFNISDQLHSEAVVESARHVEAWKEFAREAYHCKGYSDLGKVLLKLQTMILPAFIDSDWLQHSFGCWVNHCENAQSAESVETLTKELVESVLWDQVEALWDAPVQPVLGSEWKTWKQEVMTWFSTLYSSASTSGDSAEWPYCEDSSASVGPHVRGKRAKLEVRRAEGHSAQVEMETEAVGDDSRCCDHENENGMLAKAELITDYQSVGGDGWVEIVVEAGNPNFIRKSDEKEAAADTGSGTKHSISVYTGSISTKKYRQCMAFIAAKGRQCGRWANDGELYCCVHLNCRYGERNARVEDSLPGSSNLICEGTTTHGERCKHRARLGSLYCKKHQPENCQKTGENLLFSASQPKKKFCDANKALENTPIVEVVTGAQVVLVSERRSFQDNFNSVSEGDRGEISLLFGKADMNYGASYAAGEYEEEQPLCIAWDRDCNSHCLDTAKLHTLYCEKHRPNFLKRARNGKSRVISKEYFLDLLSECSSRKQKVKLHQACEILYGFMKSALNRRNRVSRHHIMEWILSEASKDLVVGNYLMKLVSLEKEKIARIWGFDAEDCKHFFLTMTQQGVYSSPALERVEGISPMLKCKICTENFMDDQTLGAHWMNAHKKEAQWLFRGYACAICMNSFTNRKVLEAHVKERHSVQSLDQCILFQCMPCGSHFINPEQLWVHVLSVHSMDFRLRTNSEQQNQGQLQDVTFQSVHDPCTISPTNGASENNNDSHNTSRRYMCRYCGLKFDLLPDLGRHHQAAHMGPHAINHFPPKRPSLLGTSRKQPGRPSNLRLKESSEEAIQIGVNSSYSMKKQFDDLSPDSSSGLKLLTQVSEVAAFERSIEAQCSSVAETIFHEIQETKPRPTNLEILSVARSTCCKVGLHSELQKKYKILPERLYLKAAKICSELNIRVEWHQEGFICPKGCQPDMCNSSFCLLDPLPDEFLEAFLKCNAVEDADESNECGMEECHLIISTSDVKGKIMEKFTILCDDISFGLEGVQVACVVDKNLQSSLEASGQTLGSMPWECFTYVTERRLDPSVGLDTKSSQLGCACPHPCCFAETCDHVYLFDNDYECAKDIFGKPMGGRFPYDEMGKIILEEGYLVYECNSMCRCNRTCRNRVMQNGVQVKLEVFKTEKKGWAVRAGDPIPRGTFVCEYIGEVLDVQEAGRRGRRHGHGVCSYLYDINSHTNAMGDLNDGSACYVIDATEYGNVSRFINHSCSPNLVRYQVLVESMDCHLSHIGLYAFRDITKGEELSFDYCYKLVPGEGSPCYCGASNCRGRLY